MIHKIYIHQRYDKLQTEIVIGRENQKENGLRFKEFLNSKGEWIEREGFKPAEVYLVLPLETEVMSSGGKDFEQAALKQKETDKNAHIEDLMKIIMSEKK